MSFNTSNINNNDKNWEIDLLVNHIISKHHTYVKKTLPLLTSNLDNLISNNNENQSKLIELKKLTYHLRKEITDHLLKEEETLFPNILEIHQSSQNDSIPDSTIVETTINLFTAMNYEHSSADKVIKNINSIIKNYSLETNSNETFIKYSELMNEFQSDLKEHVHLEDDVLFPLVENFVQPLGLIPQNTSNEAVVDDLDDDLF